MTKPQHWITPFDIHHRTLILSFPELRQVISSAVYGGGVRYVRHIVNHQVKGKASIRNAGPELPHGDPARYLRTLARELGLEGPTCGLMTAVSLKQLVRRREEADGLWVEGFFTVGITNAVRVGEPINGHGSTGGSVHPVGTINMVVVTNARLSPAALIGSVMVATEAKTAALMNAGVRSWTGRPGATGTGTDAIIVVNGQSPRLRYSGTHTKIGELLGRVVRRGVEEGLRKAGASVHLRHGCRV